MHTITWSKDTWLAGQMPTAIHGVNSLHRQVCLAVAPSLRTAGLSEDGLIEAVEDTHCPDRFFGVQWHPELQIAGGDTVAEILFDRFLHACRTGAVNPLVSVLPEPPALTIVL